MTKINFFIIFVDFLILSLKNPCEGLKNRFDNDFTASRSNFLMNETKKFKKIIAMQLKSQFNNTFHCHAINFLNVIK